jgi:hypothetical protein
MALRNPITNCLPNPDSDPKYCTKRKKTCGYPNTLVLYHKTYQRYIRNGNERFKSRTKFNEIYKFFREKHEITIRLEEELRKDFGEGVRYKLNPNSRHKFYENICTTNDQVRQDEYNDEIFKKALREYMRIHPKSSSNTSSSKNNSSSSPNTSSSKKSLLSSSSSSKRQSATSSFSKENEASMILTRFFRAMVKKKKELVQKSKVLSNIENILKKTRLNFVFNELKKFVEREKERLENEEMEVKDKCMRMKSQRTEGAYKLETRGSQLIVNSFIKQIKLFLNRKSEIEKRKRRIDQLIENLQRALRKTLIGKLAKTYVTRKKYKNLEDQLDQLRDIYNREGNYEEENIRLQQQYDEELIFDLQLQQLYDSQESFDIKRNLELERKVCHIQPYILNFFKERFGIKFSETSNKCHQLTQLLLSNGIAYPKNFYFYEQMSNGISGLIFLGKYLRLGGNTEIDVIMKSVIECHGENRETKCRSSLKFTLPNSNIKIKTENPFTVKNELQVHIELYLLTIRKKITKCRVPKLIGDSIGILATKRTTVNETLTVKSYIMERIYEKRFPNSNLNAYKRTYEIYNLIPEIIIELHERGFIHGDCHAGNILLQENEIPVLIDFSRSRRIDELVSYFKKNVFQNCFIKGEFNEDAKITILKERLYFADFVIPLYYILSMYMRSSILNYISLYNTYLQKIIHYFNKRHEKINPNLKKQIYHYYRNNIFDMFEPLSKTNITKRQKEYDHFLFKSSLFSKSECKEGSTNPYLYDIITTTTIL